jgi:hypothetical protein
MGFNDDVLPLNALQWARRKEALFFSIICPSRESTFALWRISTCNGCLVSSYDGRMSPPSNTLDVDKRALMIHTLPENPHPAVGC